MPAQPANRSEEFLKRRQQAPYFALAAIVALVAASRVWQAGESLWLDELHTAWAAGGTLAQVSGRAAIGNQSPLFFWIEWFVARLFGASELTLRLPSILASGVLPIALFATTRKWTGSPWLGLLPAWLYAVDPQAIYFGTEARPYALIQLLAVAHVAVLASAMDRPTVAKRMALVAGMAVLFYLNYTAVLVLGAEFVFWAVWARRRRDVGYSWNAMALDAGALAVVSLGALPTLRMIAGRRDNWASFVAQRPLWQGILMVPWAWTGVALLLLVIVARRFRRTTTVAADPPPHILPLALSWLVVPIVFTWAATEIDVARLLHPRYLAAAAPAAMLLIALVVNMVPWARARIGIAAAFVIVAPALGRFPAEVAGHGRLITYREDDWRGAIAAFNQAPGHDHDPVLVRSLLIECDGLSTKPDSRLVEYCVYPVTSLYTLDADRSRLIALQRTNAWRLSGAAADRVKSAPGFWMFLNASGAQADFIEGQFARIADFAVGGAASAAATARWTVTTRETFGTVRVLRFDRAP